MNKGKLPLLLFVALLIAGTQTLFAQDDDSEPSEIHLFRGGYMDLTFGLNVNTVGSSLGSGSMGGLVTSRVSNGALNVNLNPSLLGYMESGYLSIDSRFGAGTNVNPGLNSSLISTINGEIETAVNEEFAKTESWTQFEETYIKPTEVRDFNVGLSNDIASIAFAAPISKRWIIAGAYTYPAAINLDFGLTGLSAKLAQEQGTEEVSIRFDVLMNVSLLAQMQFNMSTASIGVGSVINNNPTNKLALGATLTRYQVTNERRIQADLSGMVVVGGADERYFNNPDDPNLNMDAGESNSFYMDAYGNFEATEYGFKVGANYQVLKKLNLSLVYDYVPTFELSSDEKRASAYLPVFLVGTGDEILQGDMTVALDSLQANKPNLTTEREISSIVEDGVLNLPSSLKLGVDVFLGKHTLVLNYTNYLSELSYQHGGHTIGKDVKHGVGLGFDFQLRDRIDNFGQIALIPIRLLFLDIDGLLFQSLGKYTKYKDSHYRFGGNVLLGEGIVTVNNDGLESTLGLPLPQSFSMGRQYTIFNNLDVGVTVLAIPDLFLKYSLAFRF